MSKCWAEPPPGSPPCPGEGWKWSIVREEWCPPGASPLSGMVPSPKDRFQPGEWGGNRRQNFLTNELYARFRDDPTLVKEIIEGLVRRMKAGESPHLALAWERTEGKVAQVIEAKVDNYTIVSEKGHLWPNGEPSHEGEPE